MGCAQTASLLCLPQELTTCVGTLSRPVSPRARPDSASRIESALPPFAQEFGVSHPEVLPYVAVSSGTSAADLSKLKDILAVCPAQLICLDVANGYSEHFSETVRAVRAAHPKHTIIAGNVVTGEMVEQLLLDGADIIKVGIGPGSVCTTRKQTGVGYPQLSAIIECADAAHGMGGHVMADGGCACPGDVAKAFGAGADFVMCGGIFAGHEQSGGEVVEKDGKFFKRFYGMSSVRRCAASRTFQHGSRVHAFNSRASGVCQARAADDWHDREEQKTGAP